MLASIKKFFELEIEDSDTGQLSEEKRQLACAALLIEVATIDQNFDEREFAAMQKILADKFAISPEQCRQLTELAQSEFSDASSTYQFTRLVNDHCTYDEKYKVIKGMWSVAFADGHLDRYEEYIIRKVSELIHVTHSDFIHAKQAARSELTQE